MTNNPINLEKSIREWNNNAENAALIIPLSQLTFRITYFADDSSFKIAIDSSTIIKAIENRLNLSSSLGDNIYLDVPYSMANIFGEFCEREVWIWIDRKKLKEIFANREFSLLKMTKEQFKVCNKQYLTNFFDFFTQKVLATVKEIEEKLKNKVFDKQAVFENNFEFYCDSWDWRCQCDEPPYTNECPDSYQQVLYHVRNCFNKVEDLEQFKKTFLADCEKLKERTGNEKCNNHDNSESVNIPPPISENQPQLTASPASHDSTNNPTQETQNNQQTENEAAKTHQQQKTLTAVINGLERKQSQGESLTNEEKKRLNKAKKDLTQLAKGDSQQNPTPNFPTGLVIIGGIGTILLCLLGISVYKKVKRKNRKST